MTPLRPEETEPKPTIATTWRARASALGERVHLWLRSRPGHVTVLLVLVLATLSGSMSVRQKEAADPSVRILEVTHGDLSAKAEQAMMARMDPYAAGLALAHLPGKPAWTPPRTLGWKRFAVGPATTMLPDSADPEAARWYNSLLPDAGLPIPAMKPFKLPAAGAERDRAILCLTQAVYYEAGFQSGEGQEAVAQVVLNRLRHPDYPKSVCAVVYQGAQRTTGCQFSFTCDGSLKRPVSAPAWAQSKAVAVQALNGFVYAPVGAATHYHADYVFPFWSMTLVKLRQLGAHIFYRMIGPAGAPEAFTGHYAGGELNLPASVLTGGDARTPDAPTKLNLPLLPTLPTTKTITLETGGETRSYQVVVPQGPGAGVPGVVVVPGALSAARRAPTPDEVKAINEKLQKFEDEQKAAKATAVAPVIPTPAPKAP